LLLFLNLNSLRVKQLILLQFNTLDETVLR